MLVTRRVHSSLEPSGPSSRSLSRFQEREKTRGIAAIPPPLGEGLIHVTDNTSPPLQFINFPKSPLVPIDTRGSRGWGAKVCKVSAQGHHGCSSTELKRSLWRSESFLSSYVTRTCPLEFIVSFILITGFLINEAKL